MSYLNSASCSARVAYAKKCIKSGYTHGRAFDDCFENGDGDAVFAILYMDAEQDGVLMERMKKIFDIAFSLERSKRYEGMTKKQIYAAVHPLAFQNLPA